jgi:hypothetical protein
LIDGGWGHGRVVVFVAGISLLFGLVGLVLPNRESKLAAIVVLGLVLLGTVALLALRDRRTTSTGAVGGRMSEEVGR